MKSRLPAPLLHYGLLLGTALLFIAPLLLMLAGSFKPDERVLLEAGGWTTLTAVCLMLFSLCHNPCSTTLFTIWKETRSARWTWVSAFLPLAFGAVLCGLVAFVWRLLG